MIFGRSTQNAWMKKRKPQKQDRTGLDFEINVKNCQKMSKMLKVVKLVICNELQFKNEHSERWIFLHHFKDNA